MLNIAFHRYSKLALDHTLIPEKKRIDYVLVYQNLKSENAKDMQKKTEQRRRETERKR